MNTKNFLTSKTLWMNVALMIATYVLAHQGVLMQFGLDTDQIAMVIGAANMVNRVWGTSTKLTT